MATLFLAATSQAAHAVPLSTITAPSEATGSYTVSWTATGDIYQLRESADGGATWTYTAWMPGTSKFHAKSSDGSFKYQVNACLNVDGVPQSCSGYSAAKTVAVYIQPGTPTSFKCSTECGDPDTNGQVFLSWVKPSGTVTDYRVFKRVNGSPTWTRTDVVNNYVTISGLTDGTWDFKVDACNHMIESGCSTDSTWVTVEVLLPPSVPTGFSLPSLNTTGQFTMSWIASTGEVWSYEVWRRPVSGGSFVKLADVPSTSTSYQTAPNQADGSFLYALKACNASCSSFSSTRQIDVLKVPTAPSNLTLPSDSNTGTFTLGWNPSWETIDQYEILRADQTDGTCPATGYVSKGVVSAASTSKQFAAHEDGKFCFKVRASNASGTATSGALAINVAKSLSGLPDDPLKLPTRPTDEAIGSLKDEASTDGGNVSYQISIPVPPGRKGMAPTVSLSYSSNSGEGLLGVGWSLSAGQGSVYRCPSLEAIDGETRPYSGVVGDRLCLDGEQLLLATGSAGYGQPNSVYHPETAPFTKVVLLGESSTGGTSYFDVTDKSGTLHRYGRQVIPPRADAAQGYPTQWLLTMVKDLNGNRIDYQYTASNEEPLLTAVVYTGYGQALGNRSVNFAYGARPTPVFGYTSQGFKTASTQRLTSITTKSDASTVVHYVKLRYETSNVSGRSLLAGVQLCGDTNCATSYPESVYTYSEQAQTFANQTLVAVGSSADSHKELTSIGDIDGDGGADYALLEFVEGSGPAFGQFAATKLRLSSRATDLNLDGWRFGGTPLTDTNALRKGTADFNSDGRADLIRVRADGVLEIGAFDLNTSQVVAYASDLNLGAGWNGFIQMLDLDRDGDTDMLAGGTFYTNCSSELTLSVSFCRSYAVPSGPSDGKEYYFAVQDFNGDLLPDVRYYGAHPENTPYTDDYVRFGQLSGGSYSLGALQSLQSLGGPAKFAAGNGHLTQLDANGDGLKDIFRQGYVQQGSSLVPVSELWLNTGGQFVSANLGSSIVLDNDLAGGLVVMDYDHDGRDDLLVPSMVTDAFCYLYFTGQPGGPPLDGPSEDVEICSGDEPSAANFEDGYLPSVNRGKYRFDVVRFVPVTEGTFTLQRGATPLEGNIHHSRPCDANNDGLSDLCTENYYAWAPTHRSAAECDPLVDGLQCSWTAGSGGGPMGLHAMVNQRQSGFGFDLLVSATNGLGYQHAWSYGALSGTGSNYCSYSSERPFYSVDLDESAFADGHYHYSSAMTVATRHLNSNGVGGMNAECFRYEDAMFSTRGRGFQGFKAISVDEDLDDGFDKTVRTEYYDYFPLTGMPLRAQTWLRSDSRTGNPLSEVIYEWNYSSRGDNTQYVYLTDQVDVVYDFDRPSRPAMKRKMVTTGYNANDLVNGNPSTVNTTVTTLSYTGVELVVNSTAITYTYDYSDSNWLNKLTNKNTTVYATDYDPALGGPAPNGDSNNQEVITEAYTYSTDGTRRLTGKTVQNGVATQQLQQSYGYGVAGYGNVETITTTELDTNTSRTATTGYDSEGYFPVTLRDAANFVTTVTYHQGLGVITSQANADGSTVTNTYDFAGRLKSSSSNKAPTQYTILQACATAECGSATVRTTVMQEGTPDEVTYTDQVGQTVKTIVAGFGTAGDVVVETVYDARGRKISESQPGRVGATTVYLTQYQDYDALGRYGKKVVNRSGHAVASQIWQYAYNGLSTTITLPGGGLTASRSYDAANHLLSTTDANQSTTFHRYDGMGNRILTQDAEGTEIRYYFDALGRKLKTEDADAGTASAPTETVVYNAFGEQVQSTNANGDVVSTQYDSLGRPTTRVVNGVTDALWTYDQNGKPSLSSEQSGIRSKQTKRDSVKVYTYDSFGRLVKTELTLLADTGDFATQEYKLIDEIAYDANFGRLKGRKYASGEMVHYRYTDEGYLKEVRDPWANAGAGSAYYTVTAQTARGQLERIVYGNGVIGMNTFVPSTGDIESQLYEKAEDGTDLADLRYVYGDAFGNLTQRQTVGGGATEVFTYDNLQRLDSSAVTWTNPSYPARTVDYAYDAVGNLLKKDDFGAVYHYGDAARSNGNAGPHAVYQIDLVDAVGGGSRSFSYDDAGNMTAGNGRTLEYNAFNKPLKIVQGATVTQFRYAPDQSLSVRTEGGETVYYGPDYQLVVNGGVETHRTFVDAHVVIEKIGTLRKVRYQHNDRLGSLALVTDESGSVTESHGFDAFGLPEKADWQSSGGLLHNGTGSEQLTEKGYTGHEHLDAHKLVHMGGRVYDPVVGRFLSPDPLIQSVSSTQALNAYSYVMNNPLSNIDPSGYACVGATDADGELRVACESDSQNAGRNESDRAAAAHLEEQVANGRTFESGVIVESTSEGVTERGVTGIERATGQILSAATRLFFMATSQGGSAYYTERRQYGDHRHILRPFWIKYGARYDSYYFASEEEFQEAIEAERCDSEICLDIPTARGGTRQDGGVSETIGPLTRYEYRPNEAPARLVGTREERVRQQLEQAKMASSNPMSSIIFVGNRARGVSEERAFEAARTGAAVWGVAGTARVVSGLDLAGDSARPGLVHEKRTGENGVTRTTQRSRNDSSSSTRLRKPLVIR